MPNTREKPIELISKWDVVNKLIQLENNYQFYKEQWDADVLYRRICELEIGIGKTPPVATGNNVGGKWIPVTERLPEFGKRVLILGNRKDGQFIYIDQVCADGNWLLVNWEVTHWMPLPEPPKGE